MNTKLTIKNFRVFDENGVMVNLKPITVLTGCNSSGKSSVVKAALMLNDVFRQLPSFFKNYKETHDLSEIKLDFTKYPNNLLGGFDKILHDSKTGKITFEYTIYSCCISKEVTIAFDFFADQYNKLKNAHLENVRIMTEDGIIFSIGKNTEEEGKKIKKLASRLPEYYKYDKSINIDREDDMEKEAKKLYRLYTSRINVNLIKKFLDFSVFQSIHYSLIKNGAIDYGAGDIVSVSCENYNEKECKRLYNLYKDYATLFQSEETRWRDICKIWEEKEIEPICNETDFDIIEKILTDKSFFFIPVLADLDKICKNDIEKYFNDCNLSDFIENTFNAKEDVDVKSFNNSIKDVLDDFMSSDAETFSEYFKQLESEMYISDIEKMLNEQWLSVILNLDSKTKFEKAYIITMFLNKKMYPENTNFYRYDIRESNNGLVFAVGCTHKSVEMFTKFIGMFLNECFLFSSHFNGSMTYVSSARATIKRLYPLDKEDDFTILLKVYMETRHKGTFINKWVKKFGIGDSVSFSMDEDGVGAKIRLHKTSDDKKGRLLADEGYGITQLLSILLQIQISPRGTTIAVEEPEIHLHPKYQSLLADMFVNAYKERDIQFIIETHSEYLIRRLQLLVVGVDAEQKLDKNDVSISYIYTKEEAEKENQPLVKNISICEDGYLDDTFGSGFFDEATKLSRKLM